MQGLFSILNLMVCLESDGGVSSIWELASVVFEAFWLQVEKSPFVTRLRLPENGLIGAKFCPFSIRDSRKMQEGSVQAANVIFDEQAKKWEAVFSIQLPQTCSKVKSVKE